MAQTDPQTLIENGITALKAGDHAQARQQLAAAIEQDPRNERAWLYLAAVLPPQQARTALERVLTINPGNERARRGLETLQGRPAAPPTAAPSARKVKRINPASVEELPGTANSRFVPEVTLVETLQPRSEPVFFDRGYRPIELDRDGKALAHIPPSTEQTEDPALDAPDELDKEALSADPALRHLLIEPYLRPRKRRWGWWLLGLLLLVVLIGGGVYYWLNYANQGQPEPVDTAQATVAPVETTAPVPTEASQSNLNNPPTPADPPTPVPPTAVPPSPTPTILKLSLAQNERAVLRGYIVTFSSYENRSNNFSFNGAGTPKSGFHFEGLIVGLENTASQVAPVQLDNFQAVDGHSKFLKPSPTGRVPALDTTRLQPGEQQVAWLTFEVEDGTTLRRVSFNPTTALDRNNQADVNLTLPPVTPAATPRPTAKPTATPIPTATPAPTATQVPTATPAPTSTPVVADASPNAYVPTVDIPTAAPSSTAVPATTVAATTTEQATATPTQADTPTPAATPTPALPTPAPGIVGELNKKAIVGGFAITATTYVVSPTIKPPPLVLPVGYHYETVKLTVENIGGGEVADYLATMPFYLRDADNRLYSVGPQTFEASDKFNSKAFAPTNSAPGKTRVSGVLYFLVRDGLKTPTRNLIFYATPELDSPRLQINLTAKQS